MQDLSSFFGCSFNGKEKYASLEVYNEDRLKKF